MKQKERSMGGNRGKETREKEKKEQRSTYFPVYPNLQGPKSKRWGRGVEKDKTDSS